MIRLPTACAAAALCTLLLALPAQAESGGDLKGRCTGMTGMVNATECKASVGGAVSALKDDPAYCVPKDLGNKDALAVVQKYLPAHQEVWSLGAHEAIAKAIADAYPCPAKP
ncbi:MAG TPA: Rap1a/Tai family immunity protein [Rhizomicrobium sp.]|jgi:hypothetical protein|nr:Rap1a/Tai family immunity protein [Rhizomicrobium sp.]